MSDIRSIDTLASILPRIGSPTPAGGRTEDGNIAVEDRVEISELAHTLSAVSSDPDIRVDKVRQVREAIAQGNYLTPDKLSVAVERALREVSIEPVYGTGNA